MIPKIIHYCWFGNNEKPELVLRCIESWKKQLPDWEIIEWNESNWDVRNFEFTKKAYENKKYAFISDVARLDVLYRYGGVYLDTDVEILKMNPFDRFLQLDAFFSFENERNVNTGQCFGSMRRVNLINSLMADYYTKEYSNKINDNINTYVNHKTFSDYGLKWTGKNQVINNIMFISVGEFNEFAKHYGTRTWDIEQQSYTLNRGRYRDTKIKRILRNPKIFEIIENVFGDGKILKAYSFIAYDLLENGVIYFASRLFKRINRKRSNR